MARIFLSAGEASGEHYAVELMATLRNSLPGVEFYGLGGRRMQAVGFHRVVRAEDVAVMGITEIVRHVPRIYREYRKLRRSLERPPRGIGADLAILIDFPDVNLALAKRCRRLGIPTLFFVSPQVWAWKQHRLPRIRRDIDRMLVIFPFEEPWYRERGVQATFVGHPLSELPPPSVSRETFAAAHGLDIAKQWIGLLPGSRFREILLNLPVMLATAEALHQQEPERFEFVLPLATTLTDEQVTQVHAILGAQKLREHGAPTTVVSRDARAALSLARASIVSSGTATVEAALIGTPFIVVYRLSRLSYAIAKRFVKVPHVAMANLIAGSRVVPELIQDEYTTTNVLSALRPLLDESPERAAMQLGLTQIRLSLSVEGSAIAHVAAHAVSLLQTPRQPSSAIPSPAL